ESHGPETNFFTAMRGGHAACVTAQRDRARDAVFLPESLHKTELLHHLGYRVVVLWLVADSKVDNSRGRSRFTEFSRPAALHRNFRRFSALGELPISTCADAAEIDGSFYRFLICLELRGPEIVREPDAGDDPLLRSDWPRQRNSG